MEAKSYSPKPFVALLVILMAGGCEPEDEYERMMSSNSGPSATEIALTLVVVPILLMGHGDPQDLWIDSIFDH